MFCVWPPAGAPGSPPGPGRCGSSARGCPTRALLSEEADRPGARGGRGRFAWAGFTGGSARLGPRPAGRSPGSAPWGPVASFKSNSVPLRTPGERGPQQALRPAGLC